MIESIKIKNIALKYGLDLIYLFGSKATGHESKGSDIDIAVLLNIYEDHTIKNLLLDLIFEFSKLFGSDKVDLVILNKASLALQYNVISHGKILYEIGTEIKCNYEMNIISQYLDFKRYENEYYEVMHKKILEGTLPYD